MHDTELAPAAAVDAIRELIREDETQSKERR